MSAAVSYSVSDGLGMFSNSEGKKASGGLPMNVILALTAAELVVFETEAGMTKYSAAVLMPPRPRVDPELLRQKPELVAELREVPLAHLVGSATFSPALGEPSYWAETRFAFPVGPLRCFVTRISAVPMSGESGLYISSRYKNMTTSSAR